MNIKTFSKVLSLSGLILTSFAFANTIGSQVIGEVTIVNDLSIPLHFSIGRGAEYISGQSTFVLDPHSSSTVEVTAPISQNEQNESFFYVLPEIPQLSSVGKRIDPKNFDYWAVQSMADKININGYLSQGIAYSWNKLPNPTITFCTPANYHINGKC